MGAVGRIGSSGAGERGRSALAAVAPVAGRLAWARRSLGVRTLAVVLGTLVLGPLVALQWRAVADGLHGYRELAEQPKLGDTIRVTVLLAFGSVAIAVVLGVALAWAAYCLAGRWRALAVITLLPIVVPPVANVTGWSFLLSPTVGYLNQILRKLPWWDHLQRGPVDVYTVPWIVIITGLVLVPFVYAFAFNGLRAIDPSTLTAARVSGARPVRAFFGIVLPLLRPHIFYGAAIVLLLGLGQFTAPLLLGRQDGIAVLSTEMYRISREGTGDYGLAAAYGSPLILAGAIIVLLQTKVLGNITRFATKEGGQDGNVRSRQLAPVLTLVGFFLIVVVLPLSALAFVAGSPYWSGDMSLANLTLDNMRDVYTNSLVQDAIFTSLRLSLLAVAVGLPISYAAASVASGLTRCSGRMRRLIEVLVNVPLAMPGVLFGAGVLFAATASPFDLYGSQWLLVLAYVVIVLPHMSRLILGRFVALDRSYGEASRVCGATSLRSHLSIMLPLLRSSLATGAAIGVGLLTHELSASLMVRTIRTAVMGPVLYDYWTRAVYPNVAAMALTMCFVSAATVAVVWALGGRKSWENR